MTARPGHIQVVFNNGEIGGHLDQRVGSKYFNGGLALAQNIDLLPQGGFTVVAGTRHVGDTAASAARLVPFQANNGNVYDLAFNATQIEVWGASARLHQFNHAFSAGQLREFLYAQYLDTLLVFHEDVAPWRALHGGPTTWTTGSFPLNDLPNYDYGGPIGGGSYSNGVPTKYLLDFTGFNVGTPTTDNIVFIITVNGVDSTGIYAISTVPPGGTVPDMVDMAAAIETELLAMPNIAAGLTVTSVVNGPSAWRCEIEFGGAANFGDKWTVSVRVTNKADAAVTASKTQAGAEPGEPVISTDRGWPRCGTFYQQRLLLGGLRSLPNAWLASQSGDFSSFDDRLTTADGAFLAPLDLPGGERIEALIDNRFLLVMTSRRNYWVAGSATGLAKTTPPKHVPATEHGAAAHVPTAENEGAVLYVHSNGASLSEMRYTDIDGNYAVQDLSLLAYHMIEDAVDLTIRRKASRQSANVVAILNADGELLMAEMLREQELVGFTRFLTDGTVKAAAVNGDNVLTIIAERSRGGQAKRTLERFEPGLLLHGAVSVTNPAPSCIVAGLAMHEGAEVWAIGDGDVFGPLCVHSGVVNLPKECCDVTVGRWRPPRVTTLPLSRMAGPDIWIQRRARIHSVQVQVEDTTSLAVEYNGRVYDQPLRRFGDLADVPELDAGFTGLVTVRGLVGYVDDPKITITQTRPGRLTVKSVTLEASI